MAWLITIPARCLIWLLQHLPLPIVARLGRNLGTLAWWLDARHRRVALENLEESFGPTLTPGERHALAKENFRRIGENFSCAIKTASMTDQELTAFLTFSNLASLPSKNSPSAPRNLIIALGHFGNFELFSRMIPHLKGYQGATTYRAIHPPALNQLLLEIRQGSSCRFFERRSEAAKLRSCLHEGGWILGLLSDQNGGRKGVRGPFLGRDCSTTTAPAILALRYESPLYTAICYRRGPGRWHIELGQAIPTHTANGHAREVSDIVRDMNAAFEAAIRHDPANWFWVHRRWKQDAPPKAPTAA